MGKTSVDRRPDGRGILDDARSVLLVLNLLQKVIPYEVDRKPKRASVYIELAKQLSASMHELRMALNAPNSQNALASAVRNGVELSRDTALALEPHASGSPVWIFLRRMMRRNAADPLVAARVALKRLDWMLANPALPLPEPVAVDASLTEQWTLPEEVTSVAEGAPSVAPANGSKPWQRHIRLEILL